MAHPALDGPWCDLAADLALRAGYTGRAAELLHEAGRRNLAGGALASAEAVLRRAVGAVMRQDHAGPVECIVVVDGGPAVDLGQPPEDASGPRTIQTMPNGRTPGLAGARNTGAAAASGTYLAF